MSRQKKKFCLKEREEEASLSSNGSNKSVGAHKVLRALHDCARLIWQPGSKGGKSVIQGSRVYADYTLSQIN